MKGLNCLPPSLRVGDQWIVSGRIPLMTFACLGIVMGVECEVRDMWWSLLQKAVMAGGNRHNTSVP